MLRIYFCLLALIFMLDFASCVNLTALWETVQQACDRGECQRHSNSSAIQNTTDCKARLLMYEYGLTLIPNLSPQREVFDALELQSCGVTPPGLERDHPMQIDLSGERPAASTYFVDHENGADTNKGTADSPFRTIAKAVEATRSATAKPGTVILLPGTCQP